MGILRESCDPNMQFPSSLLFGSDIPLKTGILLDDFCQKVIVREGDNVGHFNYDEYNRIQYFINYK